MSEAATDGLVDGGLCFAFSGSRLLVREGVDLAVPRLLEVEGSGLETGFCLEVGVVGEESCYAVELPLESVEAPQGMKLREFRALMGTADASFFSVAGRARQVVDWHRNNRFCGRCGAKTLESEHELAMKCPRCGLVHYPRISPAAIILVRDEERALLARSPGFPPGVYSTLAGFVEVGESVEETIRREIFEEVGVKVGAVRYFGSQPWPFPDSLMLGFIAEYAEGEVQVQESEIEDAGWFTADSLPTLPPPLSIARRMLEFFVEESKG